MISCMSGVDAIDGDAVGAVGAVGAVDRVAREIGGMEVVDRLAALSVGYGTDRLASFAAGSG